MVGTAWLQRLNLGRPEGTGEEATSLLLPALSLLPIHNTKALCLVNA